MMLHFNLKFTAYIQHIGRGGRNSEMQCEAILYFNSTDLGRPNISKEIKDYCRNDTLCRRVLLNSHFGFTDSTATVQNCCDICQNSHPTSDLAEMNSEIDKSALRSALSFYVTSSDLGEEVCSECIEQLVRFPKLYLTEEELTKDFQISSSVAQSLCCIVKQVTDLTLT